MITPILLIIILTVIHLIFSYLCYKTIQKQYYHPHGFNYLDGKKMEKSILLIFFTFLPVFNIAIVISVGWKDEKYKKEFFKPKKPFKID